ncbi:DUF2092 domain-containing protein [Synechococcus sp. Cruz-9H2]|jgi:hypothetical protein|uniref:DUF2092 domain-containing protein n=1 Tax=unclassified Synechococcus TaxID=2626047 RepID=UPI0020CDB51F|nr:DUF2092 domain-containing protein [Synechococcus sp. Cruz-7B9]MCP9819624.1 DUF2092 domain-containing protein [Synechococcus sp. Cruz-9H2]MCP9843928.1 DUF2092 domain-containing protein [Synechococcus sp. Edmonson 11F2]MCP9856054.1 DUF2092 domain-containing protein [Synechococcus sp. Cruz-9C9]MCP9863338.1 DUF2092 domain-containing protein [Synechococcus sp. Cruz-7E5]MCP9870635.1 DUF2092 domain-containing protein [Synechococcus sp. Cruz-7B9]
MSRRFLRVFNQSGRGLRAGACAGLLAIAAGAVGLPGASAAEPEALALLKGMTTYMAAQQAMSFRYDADLDVVTTEQQRLTLASSGTVSLTRPGRIRSTRSTGFADIETVFDGSTFTLLGKRANVYMQVPFKGTIETLVDELKDKYRRPLPAADLLLPKAYAELTEGVTDVKDLGSGVVGGVECDHLAFRKKDVDFQIWIAQGQRPYPCRYMITSTAVPGSPQYRVQISNFQTGSAAIGQNFTFVPPQGARAISKDELKTIKSMGELPSHFVQGGTP